MDEERIKLAAELLGMEPEQLVSALGGEQEEEEGEGMEGFYFNPEVFRKLHSIDCEGLRKLVIPNLTKLAAMGNFSPRLPK